ncbi:MAG TPA: phosphate ABC transporter substrate-binding protein PstS [Acidimicrobiales bacterium]|nr:phosphate ABC transporter substrate-binding protein PstS [Acidimicrobiales bacterium]
MPRARVGLVLLAGLLLATSGCSRGGGTASDRSVTAEGGAHDRATLMGAGSTFAAPVVQDWIARYRQVAPEVRIDYQITGSVTGIERLTSGAVAFAVSELPLADALADAAETRFPPIEVPCIGGAVAVAYNLPGVSTLRLTATTLAAIFSGTVTRWDDPAIVADNAGITMPPTEIRLVGRSDRSGTTQVLTQFLTRAAPDVWRLGAGPTVAWPTGATVAEGAEGALAVVEETVGAIGYAEAHHTAQAMLGAASIENGAGRFVAPTSEALDAALNGATGESPSAYPLTTIAFLVLSPSRPDEPAAVALRHFATWLLTEGQASAERLGYARVPDAFLSKAVTTVLGVG